MNYPVLLIIIGLLLRSWIKIFRKNFFMQQTDENEVADGTESIYLECMTNITRHAFLVLRLQGSPSKQAPRRLRLWTIEKFATRHQDSSEFWWIKIQRDRYVALHNWRHTESLPVTRHLFGSLKAITWSLLSTVLSISELGHSSSRMVIVP